VKQPHEDVKGGTDRADDLLSLDETALAHRDALIGMARHLHSATLVGNPAPIVKEMYERITHPRIGDLVMEGSTPYRKDVDTRIKGLGILVERRYEWWETDEEWEQVKAEDSSVSDEDRLTDEAWYVQYGPGPSDVCRWTNCSFVALPELGERFNR
jgi:hypothetical protein